MGKFISLAHIQAYNKKRSEARVRAAAPDLLAALEEVKAWSGRAFPPGRVQPSFLPMLEAALTKARGE